MILFIIIGIVLIITVILHILYKIFVWDWDTGVLIGALYFIVILLLFTTICIDYFQYYNQLNDYNTIIQYENQKKIYKNKCELLLPEFKNILLKKYPNFEKNIYDKITLNSYQVYLVKYPELKNMEASKILIDNININYNSIYNIDLKIEELKKNISVRNENIFIFVKKYNVYDK